MLKVKGLQPVWEKSIIDEENTTAVYTVGEPVRREIVFAADQAWEAGKAHYLNVVYDGQKYRGYYLTSWGSNNTQMEKTVALLDSNVAYLESDDGFHWTRPILGICEWNGSKENNIILRSRDKIGGETGDFFDNFFVFYDTNPNCESQKRFKALAYAHSYKLSAYSSADGIHFTFDGILDVEGHFDSLNVCFWDDKIGRYVAYVRGFHDIPDGDLNAGIRDARRIESADFVYWTKPELITFKDTEDYPIYTNNIMPYYRNRDILVGFPTRYCERKEWTKNYEELCGRERRLQRLKNAPHARIALTVTDCVFMASRDGLQFDKCDEALFTPGPEYPENWIYGNCYLAYFMKETEGDNDTKELSMLVGHYHATSACDNTRVDEFVRYTLRVDGFASYNAKYAGGKVVTKQFVFEGNELYLNFSTSAKGGIYVTIKDEDGKTAASGEIFGDSTNRRVHFEGATLADFAGRPVRLEFEMKDAKLYAFSIE